MRLCKADMDFFSAGVISSKLLKQTPFSMLCKCDLFLFDKKYPCTVKFYRTGTWEIVDFDNKWDSKEVYSILVKEVKKPGHFKYYYLFRQLLRFLLFLANYYFLGTFLYGLLVLYSIAVSKGMLIIVLSIFAFTSIKLFRIFANR